MCKRASSDKLLFQLMKDFTSIVKAVAHTRAERNYSKFVCIKFSKKMILHLILDQTVPVTFFSHMWSAMESLRSSSDYILFSCFSKRKYEMKEFSLGEAGSTARVRRTYICP